MTLFADSLFVRDPNQPHQNVKNAAGRGARDCSWQFKTLRDCNIALDRAAFFYCLGEHSGLTPE
jgi:hypothetical protein